MSIYDYGGVSVVPGVCLEIIWEIIYGSEVSLPRWTGLYLLLSLAVIGCQSEQTVILDSTPTESAASSRSSKPPRRGNLADRSRSAWASVAPMTGRLDPMGQITRITIHHSGEVNDLSSNMDIISHLRRVQSSQCRTKSSGGLGAGDLAYHFVIDRNGVTWEGRSLRYQGAHAGNSTANRGNVGICVLGNFNVQYPNARQKKNLRELLTRLMKRYELSDRDIYTHREIRAYYGLSATECPGTHLQSAVDAMRHGFRVGD